MAMTVAEFERYQQSLMVAPDVHARIQHEAAQIREAEELQGLQRTAAHRRSTIARLNKIIADNQRALDRHRQEEAKEAGKLFDLKAQRERESRDFATQDDPDHGKHDKALEQLDRAITRSESRLTGLQRLAQEATTESAEADVERKRLQIDEDLMAQHLAAKKELVELETIAEQAQHALETVAKGKKTIQDSIVALRNRNYLGGRNRHFALLSADQLERAAAAIRD